MRANHMISVTQQARHDNGCSLNQDLPRIIYPSSFMGSYHLKRVCWHEILTPCDGTADDGAIRDP